MLTMISKIWSPFKSRKRSDSAPTPSTPARSSSVSSKQSNSHSHNPFALIRRHTMPSPTSTPASSSSSTPSESSSKRSKHHSPPKSSDTITRSQLRHKSISSSRALAGLSHNPNQPRHSLPNTSYSNHLTDTNQVSESTRPSLPSPSRSLPSQPFASHSLPFHSPSHSPSASPCQSPSLTPHDENYTTSPLVNPHQSSTDTSPTRPSVELPAYHPSSHPMYVSGGTININLALSKTNTLNSLDDAHDSRKMVRFV